MNAIPILLEGCPAKLDSGIGVGLVEQIARGVKNRRKGEPVRLVYDKQMPRDMLRHIRRQSKS